MRCARGERLRRDGDGSPAGERNRPMTTLPLAAATHSRPPLHSRLQPGSDLRRNVLSKRTTCRLCDSAQVELAVPMVPTPIADAYVSEERRTEPQESYPLDLYFCRDCAHVQLFDIVDPSVLFGSFEYTTASSLGLVQHFRALAQRMVDEQNLGAANLVVDVGSNDGSFLKPFHE